MSFLRIRNLLALYASVDWDSPMVGSSERRVVLIDEVMAALAVIQKQVSDLQP